MKKFSAAISMAVLALMSLITGNTALADIAPDNVRETGRFIRRTPGTARLS